VTVDSQLAWSDHEVVAAVKGCFSNWDMYYGLPAANASRLGEGPRGSEMG